jgi:putative redox protein
VLTQDTITSGASRLDVVVATATQRESNDHTLVLVHGLPRALGMGRAAAGMLPELAEHLATESGWTIVSGTLSGVGKSTGTFSASQWLEDLAAIVAYAADDESRVSLAAFGFGGDVALRLAADDDRIRGLALFAAPANLAAWCGDPTTFAQEVTRAGVVDASVPLLSPEALMADVLRLDPLGAAAALPPKRFLIGHGSDDTVVPVTDARELLAAADGRAELRIIHNAGHWLRADPRMVATLLGWLERHR